MYKAKSGILIHFYPKRIYPSENFISSKYDGKAKLESEMQKELLPFLEKLLPPKLKIVDTHARTRVNLTISPGTDKPYGLVDFTILRKEMKFNFQCFSPCLVELKREKTGIISPTLASGRHPGHPFYRCPEACFQVFNYIKDIHPTIAFSGRNTYFALIIGGAFIRFMYVHFAMEINIMLSPIYNLTESKTQKMVYRFFRMQAMEDCVRVVESNYLYFDEGWKIRFPGDIPMTIPFPRKIYGNELSLIYVKGKYVLKFNPEEHLVHHIKNELLVYRHISSEEIPNTMQFVSHIEYENHLLLLFEGLWEK